MGLSDHYVAALKGSILTRLPNAVIVDVSHTIRPFDIVQAAYSLSSVYRDFPEGTIHIVGVDSALETYQQLASASGRPRYRYFLESRRATRAFMAGPPRRSPVAR